MRPDWMDRYILAPFAAGNTVNKCFNSNHPTNTNNKRMWKDFSYPKMKCPNISAPIDQIKTPQFRSFAVPLYSFNFSMFENKSIWKLKHKIYLSFDERVSLSFKHRNVSEKKYIFARIPLHTTSQFFLKTHTNEGHMAI